MQTGKDRQGGQRLVHAAGWDEHQCAAGYGIIERLHRTGTHPALESMRKEVPQGVLELLTIPGLRPDKVLKLHKELGVSSLVELEDAVRAGRLRKIKGLGAAFETKILQGLEIRRKAEGQRHLHRAAELLKTAERHLKGAGLGVVRVTPAGEFRRGCELVRGLSLVVEVKILTDGPQTLRGSLGLTSPIGRPAHWSEVPCDVPLSCGTSSRRITQIPVRETAVILK